MSKFPTEKILPISIDHYLKTQYDTNRPGSSFRPIYDYELKAVHCDKADLASFAEAVPEGTEAVVEYQHLMGSVPIYGKPSIGNHMYITHHQMGLALILKKEVKDKEAGILSRE